MLPPFKLEDAISSIIREEWGRILASLIKNIGDLQLAEDSLQDAVEAALKNWAVSGLPDSPAAWLLKTARRKAIDRLRRDAHFATLQPQISYLQDLQNNSTLDNDEVIPDKRLELMFTCCHPALELKTRVALTLRTLGGLTTEEIARSFLDKPEAMAQRLVRARKKISLAGIPYEIPESAALQERLSGVLAVIYFVFNEGYRATTGDSLSRHELADEAIRLCRIIQLLMPEQTEVAGLLALMLLHDSRRAARLDADGQMIALEHQQRQLWNKLKIEEGLALLKSTLARQLLGPYQLQAAISALHAEAETWQSTDWSQIVALYSVLHQLQPTDVVRLNQIVAISYASGPEEALTSLEASGLSRSLDDYQPFHATLADLLQRAGRPEQAATQFAKAIELAANPAEKLFLQQKLDSITAAQ